MDFVIPRDVSAHQGRNKEVCYVGKFYIGSELAFKRCNLMLAPRGREEKRLMVTEITIKGKKATPFQVMPTYMADGN